MLWDFLLLAPELWVSSQYFQKWEKNSKILEARFMNKILTRIRRVVEIERNWLKPTWDLKQFSRGSVYSKVQGF